MARILIGKANHVYNQDDIATLDISIIEKAIGNQSAFVTLTDSTNSERSIIIASMEQWNQINALVRKAFNLYSE